MKNTRKPLIIVSMALLLAVVLAMGGVTFAKYITTTTTNSNTATVAAWGFTLSADTANMFAPDYVDTDALATVTAGTENLVVSAAADNTANLVAPGTTGYLTFSIHGDAEVLSQITVDVEYTDVFVDDYHPIVWTLKNGSDVKATGTLEDVMAWIDDMDAVLEPNEEYENLGDYTLTWEWAFEQNENENDTLLGALQAGTETRDDATTYSLDVAVKIDIEITQLADVPQP